MMFGKEDRSTFPYWFAHWCAFQMTALNCHAWKFRYLFHDFEKPWMKLIFKYKTVQKFHRKHNRHHVEWLETKLKNHINISEKQINKYLNRFDYEGAIIDWECCHFTKIECPLDAKQETDRILSYVEFQQKYPCITFYCYKAFSEKLYETIKKLGLYHE